jgi:hypothetical protein
MRNEATPDSVLNCFGMRNEATPISARTVIQPDEHFIHPAILLFSACCSLSHVSAWMHRRILACKSAASNFSGSRDVF